MKFKQMFKLGILGFFGILLLIPFAQNIEGLGQTAGNLVYDLQPGQSQTLEWGLLNSDTTAIALTLSASGEGSEFISFPESVEIPPGEWRFIDITVTIPSEHPNDVYLGPIMSALLAANEDGVLRISFDLKKPLDIKIGNVEIPEVVAQVPEPVESQTEPEEAIEQEEIMEQEEPKSTGSFGITQSPEQEEAEKTDSIETTQDGEGGGCLISTATFGSEFAPQVQLLREIRDNQLLSTVSGTSFMTAFNTLYYSFSPTIADLERQSPIFKEAVKLTLTPLITSLSILNYVDMDSEAEVLGYGISLIMLNVAMYFVAPALLITRLRR